MVSQMIAHPDLSSPPNTVVPSVRMMSPSTIGLTPSPGATVSMCAQISSGGTPDTVPSILAIRLPTSPLTLSPALSKRQTAPSASISRLSRAAQAPSRRDRESMRTRSSRRFFSRSRLTVAIGCSFAGLNLKLGLIESGLDQFSFGKIPGGVVPQERGRAAELSLFDRQYHVSGIGII